MSETVVLVNPVSRLGATGLRLSELDDLLRRHLGDYRLVRTEREGDGEKLARQAVAQGATRLVIAGGDGTVSEAVTGVLESECSRRVEIGLLPLGTGRDFARLLNLGTELEPAVARLARGRKSQVDAARLSCRARDGSERVRCFLNVASFGLSAESAIWLDAQGKKGKRGPLSYVRSAFVGLARYRTASVKIRVDGKVVHDGGLLFAAVGNGQYFGGGMRVAPHAQIDDGQLDVVVVRAMSTLGALAYFPFLLADRHLAHPGVVAHRGALMEAESATDIWVEADGEPVGLLPVTVELLPRAITLFGLP